MIGTLEFTQGGWVIEFADSKGSYIIEYGEGEASQNQLITKQKELLKRLVGPE